MSVAQAIPVPQSKPFSSLNKSINPSFFVLGFGSNLNTPTSISSPRALKPSSNLLCRCVTTSTGSDNTPSSSSGSCSDWDWTRWTRHFSDIEQAESFASVLKFQLEDAVEREDFQEAAKLKLTMSELNSKDSVAEIMSELKIAIDEERYHDASRLCKDTGSGLVGWWVGYSNDSGDPFGRLVRITPTVGRFVGRSYSPRQLVTESPGTPLFEIFVVKEADETYVMQVVYMQRAKGNSTKSTSLLSKTLQKLSTSEIKNASVDVQESEAKAGKSEDKGTDIDRETEEGIRNVINFLKDKIPGLKVKIMDVEPEDIDTVEKMMQDSGEKMDSIENSEDEAVDLEESLLDGLAVKGGGSSKDEDTPDSKLIIGGVVHFEDTPTKDEYMRVSAGIRDMERDSFVLHLPRKSIDNEIKEIKEGKPAKVKVAIAAQDIAAQDIAQLMPSEVAKAFWSSDKVSPKVSKDVREIVKLAVSRAQKRNRLSEYTTFNRITTSKGNLDPFEGLYVGAFGPYGTEVVQLRRKYGHWATDTNSSDVEFFEYVEAVKLTGDLNVPAGKVTFRAKIGKHRSSNRGKYPDELGVVASYKGQGRIAEYGYKNPRWVEGELIQFSGKGIGPYTKGADLGFLYVVPEQSFLVLFNRLRLPE